MRLVHNQLSIFIYKHKWTKIRVCEKCTDPTDSTYEEADQHPWYSDVSRNPEQLADAKYEH